MTFFNLSYDFSWLMQQIIAFTLTILIEMIGKNGDWDRGM